MYIIKTYINTLRYVSTFGKQSILEILPNKIKKGANIKYVGTAEYKSLPVSVPKKTKCISYENWEYFILNQGKTKDCALDCWLNIFIHAPNHK